jgi:hypothetical protein
MHASLLDPRSAGSDVEEIGHRGNVCLIGVHLPGGGHQLVLRHQLTGEQVSVEGARLHHTSTFAYLEHEGKTQWCSSLFKWSAWRVKATSAEFMFCPRADGWDARWLEDKKLDYRDKLEIASFLEGGTELPLSIYDVRTGFNCTVFVDLSAFASALACTGKQVVAWLWSKCGKKHLDALHLSGEGKWALQQRPWTRQGKLYMSIGSVLASLCHVGYSKNLRSQSSADAAVALLQALIKGWVPQTIDFHVVPEHPGAPLFQDALPSAGAPLRAIDWELPVPTLGMDDAGLTGPARTRARTLRNHPRWKDKSTVPVWQVLQTCLNAAGMRWFGFQLLMVLVYFIESMFTAGSALQQQQDLLGTGASRLQGKSGAKAKAKGLMGKAGGLKSKQVVLRQQQLHYLLATRRALHSERQIATCPDGSRICFKERLCSPVMGPDSGLAAWLPPQDFRIGKNSCVVKNLVKKHVGGS